MSDSDRTEQAGYEHTQAKVQNYGCRAREGVDLVEPWTEREWCRTREKAEEKPEMEVRVQPETWRTMEADPSPRPATNCTMVG